jgi:hypothetical protein
VRRVGAVADYGRAGRGGQWDRPQVVRRSKGMSARRWLPTDRQIDILSPPRGTRGTRGTNERRPAIAADAVETGDAQNVSALLDESAGRPLATPACSLLERELRAALDLQVESTA